VHDPGQTDRDADDVGDACDLCPDLYSEQGDRDRDGDEVGDACDVCPDTFDPGQQDDDGDDVGDACDPCPQEPGVECGPELVTVSLVSAVIGPGKSDGAQWDGFDLLEAGVDALLAAALDSDDPYGAVLDMLTDPIFGRLEQPDTFGSTLLLVNGRVDPALELQFDVVSDTFTPTWDGGNTWYGVDLSIPASLRVDFWDEDFFEHDFIGVADIDHDDLLAARAAGGVHAVSVATQTRNQLLFVGIVVVPEP